jgi:hypothetical protein
MINCWLDSCLLADMLTWSSKGFKNFLRKLRGEQLASPLTHLGDEPDHDQIKNLQGSILDSIQDEVVENGKSQHKEGCGGPGGMCCCPCGALKRSADGESKRKMEMVLCVNIFE